MEDNYSLMQFTDEFFIIIQVTTVEYALLIEIIAEAFALRNFMWRFNYFQVLLKKQLNVLVQ